MALLWLWVTFGRAARGRAVFVWAAPVWAVQVSWVLQALYSPPKLQLLQVLSLQLFQVLSHQLLELWVSLPSWSLLF